MADAELLDMALEGADVAPLLMVLVHLTGEEQWLDEVGPHINGPWNFQETVPDELKQRLRARMKDVLLDFAANGTALPAEPPPGLLRKMLAAGVGGPVPEEYLPMIREEMMLDDVDPKTVHWRTRPSSETLAAFRVVIIGAGVSGLSMAIKLREAGIPFVIYEKNKTVGGTWLENSSIQAAGSIRPKTIFIRCRSSRTPRLAGSFLQNAMNYGDIWSGWRIRMISAGMFVSRPRLPGRAGMRPGRFGS